MTFKRSPATRVPKYVKARALMIRLAEEEIQKAEHYAACETRSRAAFLRLMILRGMADYERELNGRNQ